MNRRQAIGAAAFGMVGLTGTMGVRGQQGQQPNPTVEAIRTQIAELEATLTAVVGTPMATRTFDLIGRNPETSVRITVVGFEETPGDLLSTLNDDIDVEARGRYVATVLEVTNTGAEPIRSWDNSRLLLRDRRGRVFSRDIEATSALMFERGLYVSEWQPDLTYQAVVVWDVPLSARGFTLEVKGTDVSIRLR